MSEAITNIRNDVLFSIGKENSGGVLKAILMPVKFGQLPLEALGDILGEAMSINNDFFITYVYPKIMNKLKKFVNLYDLDLYILNKFCLLPGEQIITSCEGQVMANKTITFGRIYLTNARFITSGIQVVQSSGYGGGLAGVIISSSIAHKRNQMKKAISRALSNALSDFLVLEWGYYYPVTEAYNIKNETKKLIYWVDLAGEKKPIKTKIIFTPSKIKGQTKEEFFQQRDYIIKQLNDILLHYTM